MSSSGTSQEIAPNSCGYIGEHVAHQQSAVAAAFGAEMLRRSHAALDQILARPRQNPRTHAGDSRSARPDARPDRIRRRRGYWRPRTRRRVPARRGRCCRCRTAAAKPRSRRNRIAACGWCHPSFMSFGAISKYGTRVPSFEVDEVLADRRISTHRRNAGSCLIVSACPAAQHAALQRGRSRGSR